MYGTKSAIEEEGTFCVLRTISVFTICFESSFLLKDEIMTHAQISVCGKQNCNCACNFICCCHAVQQGLNSLFEGEQQHHMSSTMPYI